MYRHRRRFLVSRQDNIDAYSENTFERLDAVVHESLQFHRIGDPYFQKNRILAGCEMAFLHLVPLRDLLHESRFVLSPFHQYANKRADMKTYRPRFNQCNVGKYAASRTQLLQPLYNGSYRQTDLFSKIGIRLRAIALQKPQQTKISFIHGKKYYTPVEP